MAQELRHEVLAASTTSDTDAAAEFRNDTSAIIHIREIDIENTCQTAANDESTSVEVSKAPVFQSITNNSPFFTMVNSVGISGGTTGAALDDVSAVKSKVKRYGKGQLTLEPNESLFVNIDLNGGSTARWTVVIAYEFG